MAAGVRLRRAGSAVAALGAFLALAPAASAVQFDVTRFDDPMTDGCNSGVDCSLREAIEDSEALAGGDVVNAPAPPAGQNYELSLGQLTINDDLTLTGAGASTTTLDANQLNRVIFIGEFPNTPEVEINGVTITGGVGTNGAGIRLFGGQLVLRESVVAGNNAFSEAMFPGAGGGMRIEAGGAAFVEDTTFRENVAQSFDNMGGSGGGIWNEGVLALHKSTIGPDNTVEGGGSGSGSLPGVGAGIGGLGSMFVVNSTISGNTVLDGIDGRGGGIFFGGSGGEIDNSTLVENTVEGQGGAGGNIAAGDVTLDHTLLAGGLAASGANCGTPLTSAGHNLESPTAECGLGGTGDVAAVANPLLGPLAENDGVTQTHALLEGSPAIDAGSTTCPPPDTDQRGLVRAQGPACDIGAYELQQGDNLPDPVGPAPDICDGHTATIVGDKGDDVLMGTEGDDVIVSRTGNDQVLGLGGDDVICTRGTNDVIKGGPGNDLLRSGAGSDTLKGGGGNDKLHGANDNDKLGGGRGNDRLYGGNGNDDLGGGSGKDECFGNSGNGDSGSQCEDKSGIP